MKTGVSVPRRAPLSIVKCFMDGLKAVNVSIYTIQLLVHPISEIETRCNQILGGLAVWFGQLHTLKTGILAAAGFVTFPVNDKNQPLVQMFAQAVEGNRPTEVWGNLYFSITKGQNYRQNGVPIV